MQKYQCRDATADHRPETQKPVTAAELSGWDERPAQAVRFSSQRQDFRSQCGVEREGAAIRGAAELLWEILDLLLLFSPAKY